MVWCGAKRTVLRGGLHARTHEMGETKMMLRCGMSCAGGRDRDVRNVGPGSVGDNLPLVLKCDRLEVPSSRVPSSRGRLRESPSSGLGQVVSIAASAAIP